MDLGLRGRHALVTGAHRGTGRVIARTLAAEGALVIVHGSDEATARDTVAEIERAGGTARAVWGGLDTDAGAAEVVAAVHAAAPSLDVLVNNLGQASGGTWESADPADYVASYQLNTLSAVRMIRAFVPGMRERRRGRVIQLTTVGTLRPGARMPQYYAAKGALATLTVSLARDLAGTGVTVNSVAPGLIRTPETETYLRGLAERRGWTGDAGEIERLGVKELTGAPVGRMALPEEVAALVAFLASEQAAYLSGATFRVDGGAAESVV
ncbi:MAG: SDR family oxidoreductase [Deltaproteobacteria bacterium]|nr:SDR family oxidoreductase [Deltaproteobacteria bacterium]